MGIVNSLLSRSSNEVKEYTEKDYKIKLQSTNTDQKGNEKEDEITSETTCQHRIGIVTDLFSDYGLIDGKYYFDLGDVINKNVKQGQRVQYIAYRNSINCEWKIRQVNFTEKIDWEGAKTCEEYESKVTGTNVLIYKTVAAKIIKKDGRNLILDPGNIHCNLNKIKAEFLPMEGDWISLYAIVELKENDRNLLCEHIIEVQQLKALRTMVFDGTVSHISSEKSEIVGIIDSKVYFTSNDCEPGYLPVVNDKVVAKIIESEQGALTWRAISVLAVTNFETDSFLLSNIEEERLFDSKNGVTVVPQCDKKSLKIGEDTVYKVDIENCGKEIQTLTGAVLKNSNLNAVMEVTTDLNDPVSIHPSECFSVTVTAKASFTGYFTDVLFLNFKGDWKIACMLDIFVDIDQPDRAADKTEKFPKHSFRSAKYEKRNAALRKLMPTKTGFRVPGIRPVKPPAFLPVTLDQYTIPESLTKLIIGDENCYRNVSETESELEKLFPFLPEELNHKNYLQKFHTLLHLEDLEVSIAIKKYDEDRACFERCGEYLVLKMPNLAESRPSLIIGDKLMATDPMIFNNNGVQYEGYIHKILADSIRLKFNDSFHASYDGKDYSVTFIHSRTSVRRCHQALKVVFTNMGKDWLFPDTLKNLKLPQANVVGEHPLKEDQKEVTRLCTCDGGNTPQNQILNSFSGMMQKSTPEVKSDGVKLDLKTLWDNCEKRGITNAHDYSLVNKKQIKSNIKWVDRFAKDANNTADNNDTSNNYDSSSTRKSKFVPRDVVLKWVNLNLNRYQKEAVRNILKGEARPLPYVIFGPPGTGKTVTVVETTLQLMYLIPESRILIVTPSNSSADLICDRLLNWNLLKPGDIVRLVGYNYLIENRIAPHLKPYCTAVDMKIEKNNDSYYEENGIRYSSRQAIGRHRITVGTCVNVGQLYSLGFPRGHFTHIIIDEAGQATEPEILISLAFLNEDGQAILAGDPRQLGPVIMCRIADQFGLGESLLSRFLMRFPYHRDPESYPDTDGYDPRLVTWLLYNYRSLPDIVNLYGSLFYDSKLIPMICSKCSPEMELFNKVIPELCDSGKIYHSPIIFHGVRGKNEQDEDSPSWYNSHEVSYVCQSLQSLYIAGLKPDDIGIITPYQKQVQKIRELARMFDLDVPKVGTVEEFQGQERHVIMLSTVRSDEGLLEKDVRYSLGFVASKQRLNVAISRARSLLLVFGNPHLLIKDVSWRNLLKVCVEKECYKGCNLPSSIDNMFFVGNQ